MTRLSRLGSRAVIGVLLASTFGAWLTSVPTARALVYFADSFDPSPAAGWVATGSGWHVATDGVDPCYGAAFPNHPPASASPPNAYSYHFDTAPPAVTACTYDLDGGFGSITNSGRLTSPAFNLSGVGPPVWLHFSTWRETEGDPTLDTMWVYYDAGGGPVPVLQVTDTSPQTAWESRQADLSAAAGSSNVTLIFEFDTVDEILNGQAGWYLDDLLVDDQGPSADVLRVTAVDYAPTTAAQGASDILMGALDLNTSSGSVTVDQVRLDLTGSPPLDSDIFRVLLYWDDGDLAFDPAADTSVAFEPFTGNTALLSLFPQVTVTPSQMERLWVAFDIDATAVVDDFVGFSIAGPSYVRVLTPDTTQCLNCPFDTYVPSTKTRIGLGGDLVTFTPADLAPTTVFPGDVNVLMGSLNVSVDAFTAEVQGIDLDLTGTPPADGDISLAFILRDDGDFALDGGDTLLGAAPFASGKAAIPFGAPVPVAAGTPALLWVVFGISSGATVENFIGFRLANESSLRVAAPDTVACNGCPFDTYVPSGKTKIVSSDTLTFAPMDRAPPGAMPGDADQLMLELNLTVNAYNATASGVTVDLTGAPPSDADIAAARLWSDDGDGAFDPGADAVLDTQVFVGAPLTFTANVFVAAAQPVTLWVTYDVAPAAVVGHYVGARMAGSAYVTVSAPDLVVCSGCPLDTFVPAVRTEILPTIDTLTVSPSSIAPPSADRGALDVGMMQLNLSVDANSAMLDTVQIDLSGTGTDADIAAVDLWRDDGDGVFDAASDNLLSTGTFALGTATLPAGVTVASGAPDTLFVSYDFAAGATVGAYVGVLVNDASFISVAAPDLGVCSGCPVDTHIPATQTQITAPPNTPPEARTLTVDGFAPLTPGIGHILTANPIFAWTYFDLNGDPPADYEVRVSSAPGFGGDIWMPGPAGVAGTSLAYNGPALSDGIDYYFGVVVSDGTDWSTPPSEILFHTNTPPLAPVLAAPPDGDTTVSPGAVTLSWAASIDAEGDLSMTYSWVASTDPAFGTIFDGGTTTALTATMLPTAPATTYYWRVRANDSWEEGAVSGAFRFTTASAPLPNADPQAQSPTVDGFATGSPGIGHILTANPVLGWTYFDEEGDPQAQYEVKVGTSSGANDRWAPGPQPGASGSIAYAGAALVDGVTYYFGVRVFDGLNWSTWNETPFHTNAILAPTTPVTPTPGSTITAGSGIVVTWTSGGTDPEDDAPITYDWEVDTNAAFPAPMASGTTSGTASSGFPTSPAITYYWRVRAHDGWEDSPWAGWNFSTAAVTPGNTDPVASAPGVDGFLNATAGILHIVSATPTFNWTYFDPDSDAQTEYQVYVRTAAAQSVWTSGIVAGSANIAVYPGSPVLVDGTDYFFGVRVSDGQNWSAYVEVMFHTNTPPAPPILVAPADGQVGVPAGSVSLGWAASTDAEGDPVTYRWEASISPAFGTPVGSGTTASLTAVMDASLAVTEYFWRVRANDGYVDGPYATPFRFTTAAPTGNLTVHVAGPSGGVAGATVRLVSGSTTLFTQTTDSGGDVTFSGVLLGTYTVRVTVAGYEDASREFTVSAGDLNPPLTITLTPTAGGGEIFVWIVLFLVVAAVVLLLLFLRGRRKPREDAPPIEAESSSEDSAEGPLGGEGEEVPLEESPGPDLGEGPTPPSEEPEAPK